MNFLQQMQKTKEELIAEMDALSFACMNFRDGRDKAQSALEAAANLIAAIDDTYRNEKWLQMPEIVNLRNEIYRLQRDGHLKEPKVGGWKP